MVKHKIVIALVSSILAISLLVSCTSTEVNNEKGYPTGTALSVSLGESIYIGKIPTDNPNEITLPDGNTYRTADMKPAIAAVASHLGITLTEEDRTRADVFVDTVENIKALAAQNEVVNLYSYYHDAENFWRYLSLNLDVRAHLALDENYKKVYAAPIASTYPEIKNLIFADADDIRLLLDGDAAYPSDTSLLLTTFSPSPITPTDGAYDVSFAALDGSTRTVNKNISLSGNILTTMDLLVTLGEDTATAAVNALRTYIDDAYGGIYGAERSRHFLGTDSAYDSDELIALLWVLDSIKNPQKRDTGLSNPELSTLVYGTESEEYRTNALVASGLFDSVYVGAPDASVPDGYQPLLPPLTPITSENSDSDEPTHKRVFSLAQNLPTYAVAISSSVISNAHKLRAALALIDFLYTDTASDLLSDGTGFFDDPDTANRSATLAKSLGITVTDFARKYVGASILAVDPRLGSYSLDSDARSIVFAIYSSLK